MRYVPRPLDMSNGHRHALSYRHVQASNNGVDYGTCGCGMPIIRQHTEERVGRCIPRNLDVAHVEALASAPRLADTLARNLRAIGTEFALFNLDTCDVIDVNCHQCGYVGQAWTDADIDPNRAPCIICN